MAGMANESMTVVLGIPIPSTDPVFLAIIGLHVLFGLAALITGAAAMLSKRGVADTRTSGRFTFGFCSASLLP
jgi:hypothetical protein